MDRYNIILDNSHCDINMIWQIFDIRSEMPQAFFDRIQKISMYFMFQYCIWSKSKSERVFIPFETVDADSNRLQDNGCDLFLEFENVDITPDVFNDKYSNMVLNVTKDKNTYAVVYNDELAKYIKENYPSIKVVKSELKRNPFFTSPYDMGIIDYITYKNNQSNLSDLQNYIIEVNSFCKNKYRCSNDLSVNKLSFGIDRPINCSDRLNSFDEMKKNDLFISIEEINRINDDSIMNFFVKANCNDRYEILETYLYYLIKPEFKDQIRLRLLKTCFNN